MWQRILQWGISIHVRTAAGHVDPHGALLVHAPRGSRHWISRQKSSKPTLESPNNFRRLSGSSGAVADIGLSEILAPDQIFTSAACPSQMGCDEEESYIRTRTVFDVYERQVTESSAVPLF
jgi:hypothetical protein